MNNTLLTVPNYVKQHVGNLFTGFKLNANSIFGAFLAGFLIYNLGNALISVNNKEQAKLKAARQETVELREKINNHLIAEGFYNRPAKEVLPIMKEFGIGL
jgi:hypothetical protein